MMIQAKFRCMKVTHHYDGTRTVELLPVIPSKREDGSEDASENRAFWKYTPAGKAELTFHGPAPYEPNACYYLHFQRFDAPPEGMRLWRFGEYTAHAHPQAEVHQLDVKLWLLWDSATELRSGSISMSINNPACFPAFLEKPGALWRVDFPPAG